jgi:predicted amidophosphoribosyltransferase
MATLSDPVDGLATGRLRREWQTMSAMVGIYCRGNHQQDNLCPECREMLAYAEVRLRRCRYGAEKPTCAKCPVHCYAPAWREKVRAMMRYSGPRMLWKHPFLAVLHSLDAWRPVPDK